VERGLDPMAVIRDRAENEPMIELEREKRTLDAFESRYGKPFDAIQELAELRAK
jgi:hypothetical protein